jgi:superfamily I DNA/RNA helicase
LCWRNVVVDQINQRVRVWIYGGLPPKPYMPNERILIRSPAYKIDGKTALLSTNEEVKVLTIEPATLSHRFRQIRPKLAEWTATIPCWILRVLKDDGQEVIIETTRDNVSLQRALNKAASEAGIARERWREFWALKRRMVWIQNIYALTVHSSQGSTFKTCFVNVEDIQRRAADNLLECKQLLYVAMTRATHSVILVNVP